MSQPNRNPGFSSTSEVVAALAAIGDKLDRALFEAASEQKNELIPQFLALVDKAARLQHKLAKDEQNLLFFAMHLMGEWQVTAAFSPICRLLQCDSEFLEELLGDALTESLPRILISCASRDPLPLFDVILCKTADDFARCVMFDVLQASLQYDLFPRDTVVEFLSRAPDALEKEENPVWGGWQDAVAHYALVDLRNVVEDAFAKEYIDPTTTDIVWFEKTLEAGIAAGKSGDYSALRLREPWANSYAEFSTWYAFSDKRREEDARERKNSEIRARNEREEFLALQVPSENSFRDIGRNDPCPCGSGKKFKKCHLGRQDEL